MNRARALFFAAAVLLALLPLTADRFWMQFIGKVMITCIFAASLDLLVGFAGLVSLAHAAFFGLSAYLLAGLTNHYGLVNPLLTLPLCLAHVSKSTVRAPARVLSSANRSAASVICRRSRSCSGARLCPCKTTCV